MKKFFIVLISLFYIFFSFNSVYAFPDVKDGYKIYTQWGDIYSYYDPAEFGSALLCTGANVQANNGYFRKILLSDTKNFSIQTSPSSGYIYTVYGSDEYPDTLTLGMNFGFDGRDQIYKLKQQVNSQIKYIEALGGVMTGYTIRDGYIASLDISWDIGNEHHYAGFECPIGYTGAVVYYDLKYTDSSLPKHDIEIMKESFGGSYEPL